MMMMMMMMLFYERRFSVVTRWSRLTQLLYIEPGCSGMGDCLRAGKLSRYVTNCLTT